VRKKNIIVVRFVFIQPAMCCQIFYFRAILSNEIPVFVRYLSKISRRQEFSSITLTMLRQAHNEIDITKIERDQVGLVEIGADDVVHKFHLSQTQSVADMNTMNVVF